MKKKISYTIAFISAIIPITVFLYFKPEKIIISCPGNQTQGFMNPYTEGGKVHFSPDYFRTDKQVIKKYFFGIHYTLNDFELNECELKDNTIFCYKSDTLNNENNEEYFDLDRSRFHSFFKQIWKDAKTQQTNFTSVTFASENCKKIDATQF